MFKKVYAKHQRFLWSELNDGWIVLDFINDYYAIIFNSYIDR